MTRGWIQRATTTAVLLLAVARASAASYDQPATQALVELVNAAAGLVASRGSDAFSNLREPGSRWRQGEQYVFVDDPDGTELVNGAYPSLEGKNLAGERDLRGNYLVRDYIGAALRDGSAWVDYYWYRPGENTPARKRSYLRRVRTGPETFIVGAGLYPRRGAEAAGAAGR